MRKLFLVVLLVLLPLVWLSAGGSLLLTSNLPDIQWELMIDGRDYQFKQGVEIPLDSGVHRVQAQAEGYSPIDRPVIITDGEQVTLQLELQNKSIDSRTPQLRESAQSYTGELTVIGSTPSVPFLLDMNREQTPASFTLPVGRYTIESGERVTKIDIVRGRYLYAEIDSQTGRVKSFSADGQQSEELRQGSSSLEQLFETGYRRYGPKWYTRWEAIGIMTGILLLAAAAAALRLSVWGRVHASVRRARLLEKKKRVTIDPKDIVILEKKIRKNRRRLSDLTSHLDKRVKTLTDLAASYASERTPDRKQAVLIQKKHRKIKRRLRNIKKLRARLELF
jgi:hypothetical protein